MTFEYYKEQVMNLLSNPKVDLTHLIRKCFRTGWTPKGAAKVCAKHLGITL